MNEILHSRIPAVNRYFTEGENRPQDVGMRPSGILFPAFDGARADEESRRELRDGFAERMPEPLNLLASHDATV